MIKGEHYYRICIYDVMSVEIVTTRKEKYMVRSDVSLSQNLSFENTFQIEDLRVFDTEAIQSMLVYDHTTLTAQLLAHSMHGVSTALVTHIYQSLPVDQQSLFQREFQRTLTPQEIVNAQQYVLNDLFWELIYWKRPDFYEALTEGEHLHPGIFPALEADLAGNIVLDAAAGSGRATFDCVRFGSSLVYAIDPSPGLLHLLRHKIVERGEQQRIIPASGRFEELPLPNACVDTAISCSAFTALDGQGGEPGLAELKRVTIPGGKIIIIWPRTDDHAWFTSHGFHYVSLPIKDEMHVHFRSLQTALACARLFYAANPAVEQYLQHTGKPDVPFTVIGMNPPQDYFWLTNGSDL
jgi:ubiquinone/menaquinone biosynthesis C-methylase UbiE